MSKKEPKYVDMGPKHKCGGVKQDKDGKLHYFTSSAIGWACDDNLLKCIKKQRSHDKVGRKTYSKSFNLFSVPGPDTSKYAISFYQPDTEGVTYLGNIEY